MPQPSTINTLEGEGSATRGGGERRWLPVDGGDDRKVGGEEVGG